MNTQIHSTAVIEKSVRLGKNVRIGPYCVVSGNVELGDNVQLISHVALDGRGKTTVGEGTIIFPFASVGLIPQDLKYKGELSTLEIGSYNLIREYVTLQPGTEGGGMKTGVGNHCLFMAGAHVAHDCSLGNYVQMANNATLAGHVTVEDYAIIGGLSAVHQFVRIGCHAIIGGMSGVEHDVIPYGNVKGDRANLNGLNLVGLKRRGFTREQIDDLRNLYKELFVEEGTLKERVDALIQKYDSRGEHIRQLLSFIATESPRSLCLPKNIQDV